MISSHTPLTDTSEPYLTQVCNQKRYYDLEDFGQTASMLGQSTRLGMIAAWSTCVRGPSIIIWPG